MSFTRMLDIFVHSRFVHYLAADIEGMEMIILKELVGHGKLAHENITFCQIDIEMHDPFQETAVPMAKEINRVQWILEFIGETSPYIPIYTIPYPPAHKVTFINFINSECEKAFKIKTLLEKMSL
uniref:Methyltransferase FkbM domain-containing protein n=1 Tax=Panagrolaimus sp. ES5 TaxID=591445 RepID=A0AC34FKV5_9BILA